MNCTEKLEQGHKLILAGPEHIISRGDRNDPTAMMRLEYLAIYDLLSGLVGKDRLMVVNNYDEIRRYKEKVPLTAVGNLQRDFRAWPREAHSYLPGMLLCNFEAWKSPSGWRRPWMLGEGGAVLSTRQTILVSGALKEVAEEEISFLRHSSYKVGILPSPYLSLAGIVPGHIDGYSTLIEDKDGQPVLLVAKRYYEQNRGTTYQIDEAAAATECRKIVIDDYNLPPLAFNLLQFSDHSIAMTGGAAPLENILKGILGEKLVHTTTIPLVHIPTKRKGSIRCLTNTVPEYFLD